MENISIEKKPKNQPRFSLKTNLDLYEKLKLDFQNLENDPASPCHAFNFSVTAWHLYHDWITINGTQHQKNKAQKSPIKLKELFKVLADITNASKHFNLDHASEISDILEPTCGDWDSYFPNKPTYYINHKGVWISYIQLARVCISCFEYLLTNNITKNELNKRLESLFRKQN